MTEKINASSMLRGMLEPVVADGLLSEPLRDELVSELVPILCNFAESDADPKKGLIFALLGSHLTGYLAMLAANKVWEVQDYPGGPVSKVTPITVAAVLSQVLVRLEADDLMPLHRIARLKRNGLNDWPYLTDPEQDRYYQEVLRLAIHVTARMRGASRDKAEYFWRERARLSLHEVFAGDVAQAVPKPKNL